MTLPTGQFWLARDPMGPVELHLDEPRTYPRRSFPVGAWAPTDGIAAVERTSFTEDGALRIFGLCPKPGEAVLVDVCNFVRDCPEHMSTDPAGQIHPDSCDLLTCEHNADDGKCYDAPLHARIAKTKALCAKEGTMTNHNPRIRVGIKCLCGGQIAKCKAASNDARGWSWNHNCVECGMYYPEHVLAKLYARTKEGT
jgi:hypothetical protein